MALIDRIDGENRLIYLSEDTVNTSINPIDLYKEMRSLRADDEDLRKFDVFMKAYGNIQKSEEKFTERYTVLIAGTKIVPYNTTHFLNIVGTIITDSGEEGSLCFNKDPLDSDVAVDINYTPPQVEIIKVNTGSGLSTEEHDRLMGIPTNPLLANDTRLDNLAKINELALESTLTNIQLDIKRILGLSQENYRLLDPQYDGIGNLLSMTTRIYSSKEDCDNDENPIAEYKLDAGYDDEGKLTSYKVVKQ